ncbi:MAG: glycosyltransferase, partial [Chloroflexi bacterium]|nr:glycosyltransferase [Chloroflexota bacterium]
DIGEREPELRIDTERELVRNCQRIIASTEQEKQELLRYYDAATERISIIPCGVNLERFQPVDKQGARQQLGLTDDKIVLYVGRIEPLKGIAQLLEAMPYLQNGHKPRLIIIGGDKNSQGEMARLQGLCRELRIADSVTFPGMIKQEKLASYYSAADTCVVPSYYESFGLVALEALACGTPVVATDVGDLKNIIRQGETGYVVTDNNPHRLADKIASVLAMPGADNGNSLSIRASVSRFSWSNIAEALIADCHAVLADYFATVT